MSEAAGVWRYQLDEDFVRKAPALDGIQFTNQWFSIYNGVVCVKRGYAWDGASPSWYVPVLGWIGIPDGPVGKDGQRLAYYPTLVHDALCQFRHYIAVDKATVVALLKEMLIEYGFPKWAASLYAFGASRLGPQDWPGRPEVDVS